MLTRLEQAQQQWGGSHSAIDNWLGERQQVLINYCQLAGIPPYEKDKHSLPSQNEIQSFCQLLMDYLSAGHFEVYDQIVSQCEERGPESLALARKLYPQISASTDAALNFNDKYADIEAVDAVEGFDAELSSLGQMLEQRFELEDRLIETLYVKHTEA
ncbi:sigma D regulator [Thalassotalea ponticola]|uniref:sigma D regulator n=1 Tax=Thalassotalea ponticola TaxID=1523392 RepID=UPI0025B3C1EE|nr:sigma D regulator [Thalassotalea ponticola]MDN3652821.1 sigma D regulator [Thalassotalea ponticola]